MKCSCNNVSTFNIFITYVRNQYITCLVKMAAHYTFNKDNSTSYFIVTISIHHVFYKITLHITFVVTITLYIIQVVKITGHHTISKDTSEDNITSM